MVIKICVLPLYYFSLINVRNVAINRSQIQANSSVINHV